MPVKITDLKEQLMSKIDTSDLKEVEKVERYVDLIKSFRKIQSTILKEGETVITLNGPQQFVKAHPLLTERAKLNSSLMSLEKSFKFIDEKEKGPTVGDLL